MTTTSKRKKPQPNLAWSLEWLRRRGWETAVVERWNTHARVRQDLFGFIDALAQKGGRLLAVQACSVDRNAEHVRKIRDCPSFTIWVSHSPVFVFAWRKLATGRVEPLITRCTPMISIVVSDPARIDAIFGERLPAEKKKTRPANADKAQLALPLA